MGTWNTLGITNTGRVNNVGHGDMKTKKRKFIETYPSVLHNLTSPKRTMSPSTM